MFFFVQINLNEFSIFSSFFERIQIMKLIIFLNLIQYSLSFQFKLKILYENNLTVTGLLQAHESNFSRYILYKNLSVFHIKFLCSKCGYDYLISNSFACDISNIQNSEKVKLTHGNFLLYKLEK